MNRFYLPMVILTALLLGAALYMAFGWAPEESTMGDIQRIFYFHMGSLWTAGMAMGLNAIACLMYIKSRRDFWDSMAVATAEIGIVFCTGGVIMGIIWAKPVWGVWWVWDARLTLTFLTWLMYVAYLLLRGFLEGSDRRGMICAVYGILIVANVPMVYMANRWFRTQHPQPVIAGGEGSGISKEMWITTMVAWAATMALMTCYIMVRTRLEQDRRGLDLLRRRVRVEDAV
jgi:heme exporter protein C